MALRFKYGGIPFTADTPEEAAKFIALLKQQDADEALKTWFNRSKIINGEPGAIQAYIEEEVKIQWTPEKFMRFIGSIGPQQQRVLAFLVEQGRATDEELRNELKIKGNQTLAGILSGVSKQAAALGIPARSIFSFENFRSAGKRSSTYTIAEGFRHTALDMSWPLTA